MRQQAPRNGAEERSSDEDPFGHRGAVDKVDMAHDPSGVQPIELERPSEQGIEFCGVCGATADNTLHSDSKTCLH